MQLSAFAVEKCTALCLQNVCKAAKHGSKCTLGMLKCLDGMIRSASSNIMPSANMSSRLLTPILKSFIDLDSILCILFLS